MGAEELLSSGFIAGESHDTFFPDQGDVAMLEGFGNREMFLIDDMGVELPKRRFWVSLEVLHPVSMERLIKIMRNRRAEFEVNP